MKKVFLKMGRPGLLLIYFCLFVHKIQVASRIQTWIIEVEDNNTDHQSTTTALLEESFEVARIEPRASRIKI